MRDHVTNHLPPALGDAITQTPAGEDPFRLPRFEGDHPVWAALGLLGIVLCGLLAWDPQGLPGSGLLLVAGVAAGVRTAYLAYSARTRGNPLVTRSVFQDYFTSFGIAMVAAFPAGLTFFVTVVAVLLLDEEGRLHADLAVRQGLSLGAGAATALVLFVMLISVFTPRRG